MSSLLHSLTDYVTSKKGMWITLGIWFFVVILLAGVAPSAKEYESTSIVSIPEDEKSSVAQLKVEQYFKNNEGLPAILVFQSDSEKVEISQLAPFFDEIDKVEGVKEVVPLMNLPPQAITNFFSEDKSTVIVPLTFETTLETKELREAQEKIGEIAGNTADLKLYITGPAGIAVDSLNLFSRADIVLLLSTVGLILILLVVIYRSPLLALIPLLSAVVVYEVVNRTVGLMGKAGMFLSNQTLSIMTILLFAAVIDYSLFVFSRYREELKHHENKFEAMKYAMRETGSPLFFSGGTVLAAMLVLFFADYADYRNFAPVFGLTMLIIMLASLTLVPAFFTLFGRKSFWPKIPKVGDEAVKESSLWSRVGSFVVRKPVISASIISVFLLISASNMIDLNYEFDTIKSFPKDMPSRQGYEILEEKFEKGDLAPTNVLIVAQEPITEDQQTKVMATLTEQPLVNGIRPTGITDDNKVVQFSLTFEESPYAAKTMDAFEEMLEGAEGILAESGIEGELFLAGETAKRVDDRAVNNRDLILIVALESILILVMLVFMTRSFKMSIYMMGTILISFLAALGLGMFLCNLFFNIDAISNRVPIYSFIFLVALGIDYNIILVSRFMEERKKHSLKQAVEIAVSTTGGVISSAGIILAATFAVLMTQPIQVLFVFGFIVAVGILLDTFLIRGILLPALLVLFEKEEATVEKELISG